MLNHICASGDLPHIHGYLIHSLQFRDGKTTSSFRQLQSTIVARLCSLQDLQMVVTIILLTHDGKCVKSLIFLLKRSGWVTSLSSICFTDVGDGVAGKCRILTCIHSSCRSTVDTLDLAIPPRVTPRLIGASIWEWSHWARAMWTFSIRTFDTMPAILHHRHGSHLGSRYPTASILQMVTSTNSWDPQSYHCTDSAHPLTHAPTQTYSSTSLKSSSITRTIRMYRGYPNLNLHVVLASSTTLHTVSPSLKIHTVLTRPSLRKPPYGCSTKSLTAWY